MTYYNIKQMYLPDAKNDFRDNSETKLIGWHDNEILC